MACAPCQAAAGIGRDPSMNHYGRAPAGVPNPYGVRYHAYPTRYHGPIYTRPMFGFPWKERGIEWGQTAPGIDSFAPGNTPWGVGADEPPAGMSLAMKLAAVGAIGAVLYFALRGAR